MSQKKINWHEYVGEWASYKEFEDFLNSKYMLSVLAYLSREYKSSVIYPARVDIFKALKLCQPDKMSVMILGKEPYLNGKATGLAYANPKDTIHYSPELYQIWGSIEDNCNNGLRLDFEPSLESWAKQGVLLHNVSLTVSRGITGSHSKMWSKFTQFLMYFISKYFTGTIFVLWGDELRNYKNINGIDLGDKHYLVQHKGLKGNVNIGVDWNSKSFNEINQILYMNNGAEACIKW